MMEAKAGVAETFSNTSSARASFSSNTRVGAGNIGPARIDQGDLDGNGKRVFSARRFLPESDAKPPGHRIECGSGIHLRVPDPVEPLLLELVERFSRHLLETGEKLVGIGVPVPVAGKVEFLSGLELFLSEEQPEHADHLGGLDVGDAVDQFVRIVEPLAHDAPGMPGVLDGKRSEQRDFGCFQPG